MLHPDLAHLPALGMLALLLACPGTSPSHQAESTLAPAATPLPTQPLSGEPPPTKPALEATPEQRQQLLEQIREVLGTTPSSSRAEALATRVEGCCSLGRVACSSCVDAVGSAGLPAGDLWPTLGRFLGPLRDKSDLGIDSLAAAALEGSSGAERDRVFRMAVAGGRTRRGEANSAGLRATTLPLVPLTGQPAWIIVELPAPCPDTRSAVTGPDPNGRMDLVLHFHCPDIDLSAQRDTLSLPPASRAVWAHRFEAMPESGITLYVQGDNEPLLEVPLKRQGSSTTPGEPVLKEGSAPP